MSDDHRCQANSAEETQDSVIPTPPVGATTRSGDADRCSPSRAELLRLYAGGYVLAAVMCLLHATLATGGIFTLGLILETPVAPGEAFSWCYVVILACVFFPGSRLMRISLPDSADRLHVIIGPGDGFAPGD